MCGGGGAYMCVCVDVFVRTLRERVSLCKCREQERGEREVIFLEVFGVPINR